MSKAFTLDSTFVNLRPDDSATTLKIGPRFWRNIEKRTDLGGDTLGRGAVKFGDHELRALLGEPPRIRSADAVAAAGDDRYAPVESFHRRKYSGSPHPTHDQGGEMDKRAHKERYDAGLKTRREVLGAPYVDKAMAGVDEFNQEFVELLNTYCWNDIWNRPGLPRKMRSVLNLGMLTALGKEHELKLHLRGALNNGLTKDEIKEVFLQVAIYCGIPAGLDAFKTARDVFKERGI